MKFNNKQIKKAHEIVLVADVPGYDINNRIVIQYGNLCSTFEKFSTFADAETRFNELLIELKNTEIGNWEKCETASWEPAGFSLKFKDKEEFEKWEQQ